MGQMNNNWKVVPPFHPEFDLERCDYRNGCTICAHECSFGEIGMKPIKGPDGTVLQRPWANLSSCGACQRCVKMCPRNAIHIECRPMHTSHAYWTPEYVNAIWRQSGARGGVLLASTTIRIAWLLVCVPATQALVEDCSPDCTRLAASCQPRV